MTLWCTCTLSMRPTWISIVSRRIKPNLAMTRRLVTASSVVRMRIQAAIQKSRPAPKAGSSTSPTNHSQNCDQPLRCPWCSTFSPGVTTEST